MQLLALSDAALAECNTQRVTLEQGVAEKALISSRLQDQFRANLIDIGFSEVQVDLRPQGGEQGVRPLRLQSYGQPGDPSRRCFERRRKELYWSRGTFGRARYNR